MEPKVIVCTQPHETTPWARYVVSLSDGTTVYQDEIPHLERSWQRLCKYIKLNDLQIVDLKLCRESKSITIPGQNHRGYCYGNKGTAVWLTGVTEISQCVGWLDENDMCHLIWVKLPKFVETTIEVRSAEKAGFFLIKND